MLEVSDRPVIKAYNGSAVHLTFKMKIGGKEVFVSVEDIPENYPSSTCTVFDDKKQLDETLEVLESGGWDITVNEAD